MKQVIIFLSILLWLASVNTHAHQQYASIRDGIPQILLLYDDRYIKIEVLSDELLHFETSTHKAPDVHSPIYTTPMVSQKEFYGPQRYHEIENGFETKILRVTFEHESRCIKTFDMARNFDIGTICPTNLNQPWKTINFDAPTVNNLYGLGQYFTNPGTTDGDLVGRVWDPLACSHGDCLVSFSQGASTRSLFPIIYALGSGYGNFAIFVDNVYKQMWTMNEDPWKGRWKAEMWGDELRFFIIAGENLPSLRHKYMKLTGYPALFPKRVLGLFVSEFGFNNWDELKLKLNSLVAKKFPLEGFAMDIQWFGGRFYERGVDLSTSRMGTLEFDDLAFPNFREEIRKLKSDFGIELMLIEESYISQYLSIYEEMKQKGFLAHKKEANDPVQINANPWWGIGGMIDWTNPDAADYWHDQKRQKLIELGIHFHWADLGEPEMYDPDAYYFGFKELNKNRHPDIHKMYAFLWLQSIKRGYERNQVDFRPFVMSRAGASGSQAFGGMWSGDLSADMDSLTAHLNAAMHMSLSGIDYYSSDIGGFHGRAKLSHERADELYSQWFANSALFDLPVRPHAWNIDNNIETAPSLTGYVDSNLANIRLRYSLAPYYYTLMHNAHEQGTPIIPPLVYYFQEDPNVRTMGHERMIGPSLLAASVAQYGEQTRRVYLPRGRWYDYHESERYDSVGMWTEPLSLYKDGLFRLPLFAKAGAIIPTMKVDDMTMNILGQRRDGSKIYDLSLRIYADRVASEFILIDDDGVSNNKEHYTCKISHMSHEKNATITIDAIKSTSGDFPSKRQIYIDYYLWDKDSHENIQKMTLNGSILPKRAFNAKDACWAVKAPGVLHLNLGLRDSNIKHEVVMTFYP